MSGLDAEIRAALDDFCTTDWCAEKGYAALIAVLNLHQPQPKPLGLPGSVCADCREPGGPGFEAEAVPYPCPTVRAIAKGLGIET